MKVLVIGASGAVGSAVVAELAERHEVVRAGREHGEYRVDITLDESVEAMFKAVGPLDAIVVTAGSVFFGPLATMRPADFNIGLQGKLLGQVRVALLGQHVLRDGGSLTLTTGIVAQEPARLLANGSAVNASLEGFVRAAAIELPPRHTHQRYKPEHVDGVQGRLRSDLSRPRDGAGGACRAGVCAERGGTANRAYLSHMAMRMGAAPELTHQRLLLDEPDSR